jgi:molybdenum cofactor synthesis domain-containing protein
VNTRTRPFTQTIPLDDARAIIERILTPIDRTEWLQLHEAHGRVLAHDVVAAFDVPPFARAAMDGYAVRAEDTASATRDQPVTLSCIEQVFTGQVPRHQVGTFTCTEIATGAPMPAGADAVVMVEQTDGAPSGGPVQVYAPVQPGQNVGRQGSDIGAGQHALRAGDTMNASRIGVLAALGFSAVQAYARPRVAVISTGNEIVEPGHPLARGQLYDVNQYTVAAAVEAHGGIAVRHPAVGDTLDALTRTIDRCQGEDILVFTGGSSVGERDLLIDALAAKGEVLFHGISVKPGKPTAFGTVAGKPVFGLPGYPTSCLTNAYILLVPALRATARLAPHAVRALTLPLAQPITSVKDRFQIFTVRLQDGTVIPAFKGSGDITSMSHADGYIEIPATTERLEAGTLVEVKLF